ncbi:hypothetical protein [Pseudomonas phage vB_Pae-PA152]|nr:hypothetical protein [Pseudomonas phage vB_Pae-PA152]
MEEVVGYYLLLPDGFLLVGVTAIGPTFLPVLMRKNLCVE